MKRAANSLFYSLLAASVAAHLFLLWLLPYSPLRPPPQPVRRIFPVRLLERTIPAPVAPARARAPTRKSSIAQAPAPEPELPVPPPEPAPVVQEPEPAPAAAAIEEQATPPAAEGPPAAVSVSVRGGGDGDAAEAQAGAEIAAYQAMLSALRSRIERDIRYPGIARANGWQGTVLLVARMDGGGHLLGTLVRRSSGYETLDRAAASLLRKIMKGAPVPNPLRQPVSIEIPIVYELRN